MDKGYAIIPNTVLHDKDLPAQAKLIYGEISALCAKEGYCWASNSYFSKLYDVSVRSVQRWILTLCEKGYISSDVEGKNSRKLSVKSEFKKKVLKVPDGMTQVSGGYDNNVAGYDTDVMGVRQKCHGGMTQVSWGYDKNVTPTNPETPWESKAEGAKKSPNNTYNNINNNKLASLANNNNIYNSQLASDEEYQDIFFLYQEHGTFFSNPSEMDDLVFACERWGKDKVKDAILDCSKFAKENGGRIRKVKFVIDTLERWEKFGRKKSKQEAQDEMFDELIRKYEEEERGAANG